MTVLAYFVRCDQCRTIINAQEEPYMPLENGDYCGPCWSGQQGKAPGAPPEETKEETS